MRSESINRASVLAVGAAFCVSAMLAGCGGEPVAMPTSYALYNSKDGTFECQYPENWEAKGGGGRGPVWAKFGSGPALISVTADTTGSLMGDIADSATSVGFGDEPLPPNLEPVHLVHVDHMEIAEEEYKGYKEIAGPNVLDCSLGPARVSEFEFASTFGTAMHGYRVTILGKDKRVVVYCVCPETDWAQLQPEFDKVLASFGRGMREI